MRVGMDLRRSGCPSVFKINLMVNEAEWVYCDVGTEILKIIHANFVRKVCSDCLFIRIFQELDKNVLTVIFM